MHNINYKYLKNNEKILFMFYRISVYSVLILTIPLLVIGCTDPNKKTPKEGNGAYEQNTQKSVSELLAGQSKILKFKTQDELNEFLKNNETSDSSGGYGRGSGMAREMMFDSVQEGLAMPFAEKAVSMDNAGGGSDDYSKTNVQVEGVDEADIIKTDGKYIYAVSKMNLFIIDAYPGGEAEILSKIEFKSRPDNIFINEDRLVIYGRDNYIHEIEPYQRFKRKNSYTYFKVFDISDRKNPVQVRDLDFEGNFVNSRMIGDYVYFITSNYQYYIEDEPALPRIIDGGEVVSNTCSGNAKCFAPEVYYFDIPYNRYNFTSIYAINITENKEVSGEVYIMNHNQNMYVSENNIYITYTKYVSEYQLEMEVMREIIFPRLSSDDQEKIRNIESVKSYILTKDEKMRKTAMILERFGDNLEKEEKKKLEKELAAAMKKKYADISKELEKTIIHKISINKDDIEYKTDGEVVGHVISQFSMDEKGEYFRIATTKNRTWSRYADKKQTESYNNLYVLDENLKMVGELEGLAKGERIYSVRFMQDRAYMVTFKQVDPLFVIDLKNPKKPKVLGELKIPGFSNYLHPYDEDTLIGLGRDTYENEWGGVRTGGVKLSLFDVEDVANPKEVDTYILGSSGSDSVAIHDHKAFLFSKEKGLLVIPISMQDVFEIEDPGLIEEGEEMMKPMNYSPRSMFRGAAVFDIDKSGFKLKGKIDHESYDSNSYADYWGGVQYYDNSVKRSLYIDDSLYTFSNNYIKINKLADLEEIKTVELKKEKNINEDDFDIVN